MISNRNFITIKIDLETLVVTMVGYWYKESGILDNLDLICRKIPLGLLAGSFHDEHLGIILLEYGNLEAEFTEFTKSHGFGEFCYNVVGVGDFELYSKPRIARDLGRRLKTCTWWTENLKEIKSIKAKLKTISSIQDD